MDFQALPPEVNSGRMYSGPGSGPMLAAAAAWDCVAAELSSTASAYDSIVSGLTGEAWSGPTAVSMAAAATPYAVWMSTTAVQAAQAATQARAAAAAYDAAFTATVPPPVIAANRSLLLALIASNVLGQNTAAIAATEAHYAEMWAQDVTAMCGYAGASAHATALTPFTAPPPTTNLAALAAQSAAVTHATAAAGANAQTTLSQLVAMVPQVLQGFATSAPSAAAAPAQSSLLSILDALAGPLGPTSLFGIAGVPYLLAIQAVLLPMNSSNVIAALARSDAAAATGAEVAPSFGAVEGAPRLVNSPGVGGSPVLASFDSASSVGKLSVPQGWAAAVPEAQPVAVGLPGAVSMVSADTDGGLLSDLALGGLAGRALGVTAGSASRAGGRTKRAAAQGKSTKPTQATIIVIPPSAKD